MQQNTSEWEAWRQTGIGSSDAPVIMGVSRFKTAYGLWEERTGKKKPDGRSYAKDKGHRLEPLIRSRLEACLEIEMPPALHTHSLYPFILASLDGSRPDLKIGAEFKWVGKALFEFVTKTNQVPEEYLPQVQHQLLATGYDKIYFCIYYVPPGANERDGLFRYLEVTADVPWLKKYLPKAKKFWEMVQSKKPPELSTKDYKNVRNKELSRMAVEYKKLYKESQDCESKLTELKEKITECAGRIHDRTRFGGIKVKKINRSGNVDYSKVPELSGVDLEKYRKPSTSHFQIDIE